MLSVSTSEPLRSPSVVGAKLIKSWQDAPAASEPGSEEPALTIGQGEAPLSLKVKFAGMLGLLPVDGTGKLNAALPMLVMVTACGLSALIVPKAVLAKARLGGPAKFSFSNRLLKTSAT